MIFSSLQVVISALVLHNDALAHVSIPSVAVEPTLSDGEPRRHYSSAALTDRTLHGDSSTWVKPVWWRSYRKKFGKRHLKKCLFLSNNEIPVNGSNCPAQLDGDWYMCMFGSDQSCDATSGPLPGATTGRGLGRIHPTFRCTCQTDLVWNCGDWKPCATSVYRSKFGVLEVELPLFDAAILKGYDSISELDPALVEAAKFVAIQTMKSQQGVSGDLRPVSPNVDGGIKAGAASNVPSLSASGKTAFETNNQEQGVDEADAVKSDGTYVYAAYGDVLVVWDALSGKVITNVTMPVITETTVSVPTGGNAKVDILPPHAGILRPIFYQPNPAIQSLLLESNRLVVIVDGYGYTKRATLNLSSTVLYELLSTHVRVYDTSTLSSSGELTFVKYVDINGSFRDARSIGENIHIVTSSTVNTWEWLSAPLQKWSGNFAQNVTDEEYKLQAGTLAKEKLIPTFVKQLMTDITMFGTPKLFRISLWESNFSGTEDFIFSGGAFQSYTQVTSFAATDSLLNLSLAGCFMPTSWGYTYSTKDMLIFAAEGWDWLPARNATSSTTYLVGMKLVGATATPAVIGSFPGRLLNQYSLDVFEGHLRAATNIPTLWQWPTSTAGTEILVPIQVPSSQNQVIILEIPSIGVGGTGMFSEVSRISKLGKDGETFTAVRFFDNVAYAVTFERTDPFYVLDLDVVNPRVLGELEITGFSSYLHSINADNTLILAIGEEAGSDGRVLGLKISLFDSTDPAKPTLVQNYTVEQDQLTWSSSAVTWDFKAFRYLPLTTPEVGILIIPVQVSAPYPSTEGNFDGFIAYDISRQGISERGKIAHIDSGRFYGCYSYASLPIRSLVFNGKVTTLKGHSVISTDLDTFVKAWEIQLDDGLAEGGDAPCFYWF